MSDKIIEGVNKYYTEKIVSHGLSAKGVDWNSKESQYLRFQQLLSFVDMKNNFSILDYGCGYGELINFIKENIESDQEFEYYGYDISEKMLEIGVEKFSELSNTKFSKDLPKIKIDYAVASGLFNVRLDLAKEEEWLAYIIKTITTLSNSVQKGFSFNALTKYSDNEYMKDYLYYADPLFLFDYCKKNFSRNVALLHDYDLYEFTIIVRK